MMQALQHPVDRFVTNRVVSWYVEDGCFSWTFEAWKVRKIVTRRCTGKVLNLFAGKTKLPEINETRVDISDEFKPDHCMPASDFLKLALENGWKYDTIIYDPPWNERKSKEYYKGKYVINYKKLTGGTGQLASKGNYQGQFTKFKDAIVNCLKEGGIIISVGYEITNFGLQRGMELIEYFTIDPKGEIRPYFVSIERKQSDYLNSHLVSSKV